jgi:hypothetical protein
MNDDNDMLLTAFLKEFRDESEALPGDTDLFERLGIDGDDAFEFIERFAAKFEVDVTNFLWYFHHGEEGLNPAAIFFRPPYCRVQRIPITPDVLREAIRTKHWPLQYPEHRLPRVRWDIVFALPATLLLFAAVALLAGALGAFGAWLGH